MRDTPTPTPPFRTLELPFNADSARAAAARDRQFFRKHPKRRYRIRPLYACEFPPPIDYREMLAVFSLSPETRITARLLMEDDLPADELPEEACKAIFDHLVAEDRNLAAQVRAYSIAGHA
jgi:hypothetical protein